MKQKPYLVYTSAGDMNAVDLWLDGHRDFDLWITYYGKQQRDHWKGADYLVNRPGGKFPNLLKDWLRNPAIFSQYQAILVMDDDIVIDAVGINRLFQVRDEYSLTVLQPAFIGMGKISYPLTKRQLAYKLRYTDFVEVSCPLFRTDALETFLKEYDGGLIGWGVDFWFLHVLSRKPGFRAAIVDAVGCINPDDEIKLGRRQITMLQSDKDRQASWDKFRQKRGIDEANTTTDLGGIRNTLSQSLINGLWDSRRRYTQLRRLKKQLQA